MTPRTTVGHIRISDEMWERLHPTGGEAPMIPERAHYDEALKGVEVTRKGEAISVYAAQFYGDEPVELTAAEARAVGDALHAAAAHADWYWQDHQS